ncbi:hypothetical protein F5Y02DRAFT_406051 [Annulohypoxylon stygium]|nr:hypothetical protein F5Y02DRAFT_406051 [Annulohypoxylon stygium]
MHQVALLQAEVQDLREANQALSKRRKAKKRRTAKQGQEEEDKSYIVVGGVRTKQQRCRRYSNTGHNAHTYEIDIIMSSEEDLE